MFGLALTISRLHDLTAVPSSKQPLVARHVRVCVSVCVRLKERETEKCLALIYFVQEI